MEGGAHDVVVVAGEDAEAGPALEVPKPEGLVIGRGQGPGVLVGVRVELHRADVVQVAQEGEEAAAELVVPDLDLVVVASGHDEGLVQVEVDAADGPLVLLEAVHHGPNPVVPPARIGVN